MDCLVTSLSLFSLSGNRIYRRYEFKRNVLKNSRVNSLGQTNMRIYNNRKLPKNLRYPRRTTLPPDPDIDLVLRRKKTSDTIPSQKDFVFDDKPDSNYQTVVNDGEEEEEIVWESEEVEAISSLFQGRIPQKPGKLNRERPLPLPIPYKLRPMGLPTPKRHHVRLASSMPNSSRASLSNQVYKNPEFLIGLARAIRSLPLEKNVSLILNKCAHYLRKGSLSLTIRELGHMGLPDRALQTFCWAQKQPHLFPDDRILASIVEVLARTHDLKVPINLKKFTSLASRGVIEAMVRGFIRGGSLNLAWKLLLVVKNGDRILDPSIYAKLILEFGKNPDKQMFVLPLLDELGERDDLNLNQQDCTAIMKVCTRLGKFEAVESLYNWYQQSGRGPSVVMYTTVIHSRYCEKKYREAVTLAWEMEASDCLLDLPAYRVVIKLFVALNDLSRTVKYFTRVKEAGFFPTYDIYRDVISIYLASGRLAKCREVCKELEIAGFKLDKQMMGQLLQLESKTRAGIDNPKIEVRFKNLYVEGNAYVGNITLPTLLNTTINSFEDGIAS